MIPRNDLVMGFVGVSTGQSSIRKVFPVWAEILGLPTASLVGHDVPLDAGRDAYRDLIARIRDDDAYAGALITTHKIAAYQAAADLFDEVDEFAALCGEISSVSKKDGKLIGHAKDPVTAGLALEEFLTPDHFERTGGHVLCLGAGGSGTAITWYLAQRSGAPRKIICTGRRQSKLDDLRSVLDRADNRSSEVEAVLVSDGRADELLAQLPEGSLVINATGLGKDRPGSPLTDAAAFPRNGLAWEFNYRGSLEFLHQAQAQKRDRGLTVVDGWRYFIHGWTQVVAEVFEIDLTPELVEELARAAEVAR